MAGKAKRASAREADVEQPNPYKVGTAAHGAFERNKLRYERDAEFAKSAKGKAQAKYLNIQDEDVNEQGEEDDFLAAEERAATTPVADEGRE